MCACAHTHTRSHTYSSFTILSYLSPSPIPSPSSAKSYHSAQYAPPPMTYHPQLLSFTWATCLPPHLSRQPPPSNPPPPLPSPPLPSPPQIVLDPLSSDAQRIIPIIAVAASLDIAITLILNPTTDLPAVPLKAFFRYVWSLSPTFDSTGNIDVPLAVFSGGSSHPPLPPFTSSPPPSLPLPHPPPTPPPSPGLPSDNVLTLAVHPPDSWMVTSSSAPGSLSSPFASRDARVHLRRLPQAASCACCCCARDSPGS